MIGSPHGQVFWWATYSLNVTGCQQKCNEDEMCNSIEYTIGGNSFEPGDCFLNKGTNHKDCQGDDYDVYIKNIIGKEGYLEGVWSPGRSLDSISISFSLSKVNLLQKKLTEYLATLTR